MVEEGKMVAVLFCNQMMTDDTQWFLVLAVWMTKETVKLNVHIIQ